MKRFDPENERRQLEGDVGYRFDLRAEFEEARRMSALGGHAHAFLNDAVSCLLVGLNEPAEKLLERAHEWLTIAVREQEEPHAYCRHGTELIRHLDLSMANWLLYSSHDLENLNLFVYHSNLYAQTPDGLNSAQVALALVGYLDDGAHDDGLDLFSRAGMAAPKSLGSIRNEGQMCYVLFRHRKKMQYTDAEVTAATQKFLKRSMNTWLLDGDYLRAAQWMKVIHWQPSHGGLSPRDAMLKCYEYLPDTHSRSL